jgi:hypothetical protein
MSTENPDQPDDENWSNDETSSDESPEELNYTHKTKLEVHQRDRKRCRNCRKTFTKDLSQLDADHTVPQGAGGASFHSNLTSLCRVCHEAKHGEREIAPTIRFMSTGDMSDDEFRWFRHFWDEILPALTEEAIGHRIEPLTDIDERTSWQARHIPMGAVRLCDEKMAEKKGIEYAPMKLHHYW